MRKERTDPTVCPRFARFASTPGSPYKRSEGRTRPHGLSGKELSEVRKKKRLSLKKVAEPSRISAAYLHKIESGLVNDPSPRVLARIALTLDVSYLRLMELAGYLDEMQLAKARARETAPKPHPLVGQRLSLAEWQAISTFIKELISHRKT